MPPVACRVAEYATPTVPVGKARRGDRRRRRRGRRRPERAAHGLPVRQEGLVERDLTPDDTVSALDAGRCRPAGIPFGIRRGVEVRVQVLVPNVAVFLDDRFERHRATAREAEVRDVEPLDIERAVRRGTADSRVDRAARPRVQVVPERRDHAVGCGRGGNGRVEVMPQPLRSIRGRGSRSRRRRRSSTSARRTRSGTRSRASRTCRRRRRSRAARHR